MSDEPGKGPVNDTDGQPEGTPEGTPPTDPTAASGHAASQGTAEPGTPPPPTSAGTPGSDDDAWFDRKSYQDLVDRLGSNPELSELRDQIIAHEKGLTAAYTRKTQDIAESRKKAQLVDQFETRMRQLGPAAAIMELARSFNVSLDAMVPGPDNGRQGGLKDNYDSISEFAEDLIGMIEGRLDERLSPIMSRFQEMSVSQVENQLNTIDPDWRVYEDRMSELATNHPTLMKDPATLYRMAVPQDVQERRAVKAALDKLEKQSRSAAVSGPGTSASTTTPPKRAGSFAEAAQGAIDELKKSGRYYVNS